MRDVRRKDREIGVREAQELLTKAGYGVLSTVAGDGRPYGIPLSFVFKNGCIYFHCALEGHKLDNITANPLVSFCVVGETRTLPDQFATEYESAVAAGVASEVQGAERYNALVWLLEKYSPGFISKGKQYIDQKDSITKVIRIAITHISGKARRPAGTGAR
jgi:nitroimidazol reductase NimA-like FMN-containing flavoprotein (pyridoxamine 5'-phosphate oxidase superfamily)